MYSLGCPPSNSDHLRIISCFVWWQLLTVGNRDNQMHSSWYGKKASFAPLHDFFHFSRRCRTRHNDIPIIHIFFYKDTKPYRKISRDPDPQKIDPEVRKTNDFRRSDPKICSFNKFLSKKRYGYQGRMWRFVFRCFFPRKKTNSTTRPKVWSWRCFLFFFSNIPKGCFFGGPWFLGKKQFFFFNLKHEGKLEDDYLGEWNLLKICWGFLVNESRAGF